MSGGMVNHEGSKDTKPMGPCLCEGRDYQRNHQPMKRWWSCIGCSLMVIGEHGDVLCNHPSLIEEHGCHQFFGVNVNKPWKMRVRAPSWCPVKEGWGDVRLYQPEPALLMDKGPEYYGEFHDKVLLQLKAFWEGIRQ